MGGAKGWWSATLFDVLQSRIEHFFHSPKLGAPQIAHVVKAPVYGIKAPFHSVEASINPAKPGVDVSDDEAHQRGVKEHRNADQNIELFVGHHYECAPPGTILS